MKNLFDFGRAYGFGMEAELPEEEVTPVEEDVEVEEEPTEATDDMNTQELQEEIPQVINTDDVTNVVDDLGETFEEGNDERPVTSDIDYIPEDLKSEIDAIEAMADQHAQVGEDLLLPEEDPYHETPGGMSLTEDTPVNGMDEVEEYAKSVNEINVTGCSGDVDQYMRDEYNEDGYGEDSITGPAPNESVVDTPEDAEPLGGGTGAETELQSEPTGNDEDVEVSIDDLDGEEDENEALPDAKDVLGTESEDFEEEEEVADEDVEEDEPADDNSDDSDEAASDSDEVEEEVEVEEEPVEDGEDEEISMEDDGESVCAEEHAIVDALDVDLNMDSSILTEEKQEEAEQAAEETEVEIANVALDEVSEMAPVNSPTGETEAPMEDGSNEQENTTIGDDTMMSDVLDQVKEDSHGDEDSFYEGDFSVTSEPEDLNQISEGEASYDEGAGEPVDGEEEYDEEVSEEEAEDDVEEDAVEDEIDGDGEAVDTPEEADVTVDEETEDEPVEEDEEEEEYLPEEE